MSTRLTLAPLAALAAALAACGGSARQAELAVTETCSTCHGSAANPAPAPSVRGLTATTELAVGAHQSHVRAGPLRGAIGCSECHVVPGRVDQDGHMDKDHADVTFGPLARTGAAAPLWDRTAATCSGVYCHGAALPGGSNTAPQWTKVDGTQAACGTCHAIPPPPETPHPVVAADATVCWKCHPGTVKPDGTIDVASGLHIDGIVEAPGACTACHGDPDRTPASIAPAPPRDTKGNTDTASRGVGAHQSHLGATLATPVACSECHVVPSSTRQHPTGTLAVQFGPRASANGAAPAWSPTSATCSATWCHGSQLAGGATTAPVWTRVDGSQRTCTSCHGDPPPNGQHARHVNGQGFDCVVCHGTGYARSGSVLSSLHVNGVRDVGVPGSSIRSWTPSTRTCLPACHGRETW
jgi:predicted CxxxxCH...CXXCH cytochrome family protein